MILTCPNCATRFFADDLALGPAGRQVECDACGEVWSSMGGGGTTAGPSDCGPAQNAITEGESATAVDVPLFVERVSPARKTVSGSSRAPWVIGLLIVAFVIVGVFGFHHQIERTFPGASTVYDSIGLGSSGRAGG